MCILYEAVLAIVLCYRLNLVHVQCIRVFSSLFLSVVIRDVSLVMGKESLKHMRTTKVQASLRIRAVSPERKLFAILSGTPKRNFSQRTRLVTFLRVRTYTLKY